MGPADEAKLGACCHRQARAMTAPQEPPPGATMRTALYPSTSAPRIGQIKFSWPGAAR